MQADFQRTFVMMRPLGARDSASTGFCRMERKGNRGKLVFSVQGIQRNGTLHAVLVSEDAKNTRVIACGELHTDARGQGTLTYTVDNLTSSAASGYRAVCIAGVADDVVDIAMVGFFGKGRPFDRDVIERLAAKTLGYAPSVDQPAILPETESVRAALSAMEALSVTENPAIGTLPAADEICVANENKLPVIDEPAPVESGTCDENEEEANQGEILRDNEASQLPSNIWAQPPMDIGTSPALGLPEELSGVIWPDSAAPLRELFERFEVVAPVTGVESEVFVAIPMNGGMMGIDHYLLGARVEMSMVSSIGYGIPGASDQPPSGLEGYSWMDTPLGGYWMKWEAVS